MMIQSVMTPQAPQVRHRRHRRHRRQARTPPPRRPSVALVVRRAVLPPRP